MTSQKTPLTGGSYVRRKDGSLTRNAHTEDAPEPRRAAPAAPAATITTETAAPADLKKGK